MNCKVGRGWPLLTAALAACLAASANAQSLPPAPVPVAPPTTVTPGPANAPLPIELNPPPLPPGYHDPLPDHDALLNPSAAPPGWFGAVEVDVVAPHLKNGLSGTVSFGNLGTDTVQLPSIPLDWAAAPRFDLGYRFADNCGDIVMSYRFLDTEGRADILDYDPLGDGWMRTRLDLNVFDFDYGTPALPLGPRAELKGRLGVRLADVYFDAHAAGGMLEQHLSNEFIGAGPHAGLDLWYRFPVPGLGLFARLEGALPVGHVHQRFEESFTFNDGSVIGASASQGSTRLVPTVNAQLGLGWQPPGTRLRFSVGYEYEYWWGLGHAGGSSAELFDQGAFFRAEFRF
jgi:hypothetical protein